MARPPPDPQHPPGRGAARPARHTRRPAATRGCARRCSCRPREVQEQVTRVQPARPRRGGVPHRDEVELRADGRRRARGPKYFVVNADEMEPGTLKDRLLLEGDPHQLIEGAIIGAYAIEADVAYIFLRWDYKLAAAGWSGPSPRPTRRLPGREHPGLAASTWSCTCTSAPAATCAARRPACSTPWRASGPSRAAKPPFPQTCGLWGKPTVVNNVETVCNLPHIWQRAGLVPGPEPHRGRRHQDLRRQRPGEAARAVGTADGHPRAGDLEEHAGGMRDGYRLRGFLPGGASTEFLTERAPGRADGLRLDDEGRQPAGHRHDDRAGRPAPARWACCSTSSGSSPGSRAAGAPPAARGCPGCCAPWRRIEEGAGSPEDLEVLDHHAAAIGAWGTPSAPWPRARWSRWRAR